MNRQREQRVPEREARSGYPWVYAAIQAKDPNAFLMGLGQTDFAALLAEFEAMGPAPIILRALSVSECEPPAAGGPVDAV
jgi:hypothetical protein